MFSPFIWLVCKMIGTKNVLNVHFCWWIQLLQNVSDFQLKTPCMQHVENSSNIIICWEIIHQLGKKSHQRKKLQYFFCTEYDKINLNNISQICKYVHRDNTL